MKKLIKNTLFMFTFVVVAMNTAMAKQNTWQAAENVYAYSSGHGFNSMFVISNNGVVVFDSANTEHAKGLLSAIRKITDLPIKYVLQSHNHWDHAGGGQVFRDLGAKIIAHEEAYKWMKGNPHPDLALPDQVWQGKRKSLVVGELEIEFHYVGMSHGMGMTVFVLPKQRVAYIADLVTPNRVMFAIVPDFNINEWKRALTDIEALNFEKAVFSHSHAQNPIGTKQDVVLEREYIEDLQAAIVAEFKKGSSFESIPGKIELEKYKHWVGYNEWLEMNVLRVMLDMWMGPYPWHQAPNYQAE